MRNFDGTSGGTQRPFALLDHVPGGLCVLRKDQTVAYWNDRLGNWTGVSPDVIIDRALADFFPRCATPPFRDRIRPVFSNRTTVVLTQGDEEIPFNLGTPGSNGATSTARVCPIAGQYPGETYALIVVEESTAPHEPKPEPAPGPDLAELAKRCRELEDEKAQLLNHMRHMQRLESLGVVAGGIAHDFNNLLSVVMGNADVLAVSAAGQQLMTHCCGQIQEATRRASELVAQILAYSGGGQFVLDAINLSTLITSMQRFLKSTVPGRVQIEYELAEGLPEVSGDADQFQQVLANLIAGAADAIGSRTGKIGIETGTITASQRYLDSLYPKDSMSPGELVYLEVRDDGPGLEQEVVDSLFEPGIKTGMGDRGLGLAASIEVVRAHNGGIRVWSTTSGGTAVRIHFPALADEEIGYADEHRVGGLLDARSGRGRILLVDDEEMVRALGEIILEQNGFTVVTASDGDEAISVFETYEEDLSLVLLDVSMPKRDGYEVARIIRAIRGDIPIILCSGYPGVDARSRFAELQVDDFLQKPYHADDLLEAVDRVCNRYDE